MDGNKLNNSLENLRWATPQENARNVTKRTTNKTSSKYKGVSFEKERNRWRAQVTINKKGHKLGRFKTEAEAGQAYNNFIIEHKLEEFWVLNIID